MAATRRRRLVMAPTPPTAISHRIPLTGTRWSVWRDVCVRSAGFPADMVLAICDEELANCADLDGADRDEAYDAAYPDAAARLSRAIAGTAADPSFQEALTWQNPVLAQLLEDVGVG